MKAWLQRHDLSSEEFEVPDASAAKELLHKFDWTSVCEAEARSTDETCPAGLGLVVGTGHILHICPGVDGRSLVHYHFPKRRRLFGGTAHDTRTWDEGSTDEVERMIDDLFSGDFEAISRRA